MSIKKFSILALIAGVSVAANTALASVEKFYKGRKITITVGASAGGGYDFYTRTLAMHMGAHIPGNPTMVVANMPGGGGLKSANWLYNVAPRDGSVIGSVGRSIPVHAMLGKKGAKLDPEKFNWLGSMNSEVATCVTTYRSKAKNFDDAMKHEVIMGGTGPASDTDSFLAFAKNMTGAKFRLITGYPGTRQVVLAMERGEVDGLCGWSFSSLMKQKRDWFEAGKFNFIMQLALRKHPMLSKVPLITDLARSADQKKMMKLLFSRQTMGRPFAAPPEVPVDRVMALRKAFDSFHQDPKFKAYAKRLKLMSAPVSGAEVAALVSSVLKTPKELIERTKNAIKYRGKAEKVKLTYITETGVVTASKRGGRKIVFKQGGKKKSARVSGKKTKVFVNGKKVKRKAIKKGMTCDFKYLGSGTQAKKINCKS
ncbi:MAG: hypothetical protein VX780_12120 [Pseudomonadota bacterium]|nr:hypothetical protein [Pseudomonadota bacterium]